MGKHSTVNFRLASAVATDATFTVGYPSGKGKGNFLLASDHKLFLMQKLMLPGRDMTLSFGDTSVTVTYKGTTTIPAGTEGWFEFGEVGDHFPDAPPILGEVPAGVKLIDLGCPALGDADGYAASQSVAENAFAVLNGALTTLEGGLSVGIADNLTGRNVVASWTGTAILTVICEDAYGVRFREKSASGTSFTGKKAAKRLISAQFSAAVTSATIGTGDEIGLPFYYRSPDQILAQFEAGVKVAGASNVFLPFELDNTELTTPVAQVYAAPVGGQIKRARIAVTSSVTTGGVLTFTAGGTVVTGLSFTVTNGATVGHIQTDTPTVPGAADTWVSPGAAIIVTPDAAWNGGGAVNGVLEIEPGIGVFTPGLALSAAGSDTSADVRGTVNPFTALDGIVGFQLLAQLDGPYLGPPQYAG